MLKQHILYICWLLALGWAGCQKAELPPSGEEPPVFSSPSPAGSVLTAGVGGIYLYTDAQRGSDGVITLSGTFEPVGCGPAGACAGGMRFEVRNTSTGAEVLPAEALHLGEYQYAWADSAHTDTLYRLSLSAEPPGQWTEADWLLNGSDSVQAPSVVREFTAPIVVQVRLRAFSTSNSSTCTTSHGVPLSSTATDIPQVRIMVNNDSFPKRIWAAIASGGPALTYQWSNGIKTAVFADTVGQLASYAVTVTDDNTGLTASAEMKDYTGEIGIFETPTIISSVEKIFSPTPNPLRLGQVALQWVDDTGRIWRSDRQPQPGDSFFVVNRSEDYEANEKGQRTRRMSADFRCRLYSTAGEWMAFSGSSEFAVAY